METQTTDRLKLAAHFVNSTNSPIFLTGKAGTGKTTFLRNLAALTHKTHVIVAPTGIAALHAKGVTIHSQFLLPLGSFLPTREPEGNFGDRANFYTQYTFGRKQLNLDRKKVLHSIELLIIDEVSMLRADILDAIDYRLRSVKRNFDEPFGGTQVLLIGDLFQLPPIVRDHEWQVLGRFYKSMHFFEAHVLKQSGMVYLELDKIFRQKDDRFIGILNNLRENKVTSEGVDFLNRYYKTPEEIGKVQDTIIITTHNYKAEERNQKELKQLKGRSHFFNATVENDFPESLFPLPQKLELKEGAQIMFIRNDSSGHSAFFNGKMARVRSIDKDEIKVTMLDSGMDFQLKKEVWENKKYVLNEETKELAEEVIGTFEQYPVKLAWAVTVHKSQGLTFDKAIIDVGQAFAPGQVYVALSRLRSLDGLILPSRIQPHVINSDPEVLVFTESTQLQEPLERLLTEHQKKYVERLLAHTFRFEELLKTVLGFVKKPQSSMEFEDAEMKVAVQNVLEIIQNETKNSILFQRQLSQLLENGATDRLLERLEKGRDYYFDLLKICLRNILIHTAEVENFSKTKSYREELSEVELLIFNKMGEIKKVSQLVPVILKGEEAAKMDSDKQELAKLRQQLYEDAAKSARDNPKFASTKTGRKKTGKNAPGIKLAKGETYEITYKLSEEGKSIKEITALRGLAESTIRGHLAKGIEAGKVSIHRHLTEDKIGEIAEIIKVKKGDIRLVREAYPDKYDYGTLKMVKAYLSLVE